MKKENKKKVVTLSAMAALLAVVLGMGGKTYAKYFSEKSYTAETATVAKWGFVINVNAENLFPGSHVDKSTVTDAVIEDGNVVVNADGKNVVYPGTTGSVSFSVTGTAEVKSKLTVTVADGYKEVSLTKGGNTYYPMKWTLTNGSNKVVEDKQLSDVVDALNNINETVNANTSFTANYSLSWNWAFEQSKDEEDSVLGLLAAGKTSDPRVSGYTYNLDVAFGFTIRVEQAA